MFWGRVGAGCGVRDLLCDINSVLPEAKQAPSPGFREELTPPCSPASAAPRLRQALGRAGRVRDRRALGLPRTSATRMPAAGVLPPCPPPRRARGHLQPRGTGHGRLCCLCVAAPRPGSSLPPRDAGAASRGAAPAWGGGGGGAAHGHPSSPGLARRCRARAAQLLGGSPVRFAPRRPGGHGLIAASRSWLAFPPCLCLHAMDWTVFPAPKSMCPNPAPCVMHVELESWGSEQPDEGGVFVAR